MSRQQSHTRGKQSTAQKRDSSRHGFGPIPATSKVAGASGGNEPTGRTAAEVMSHYTEEKMRKRGVAEAQNAKTETAANEGNAFNPVIEPMPEKAEK